MQRRPPRHERRPHPVGHRDRADRRRGARRAPTRRSAASRSRAPSSDATSRQAGKWLSPLVGILVGSESDRARMQAALDELDAREIAWEFEVRSAHRTPDAVAEYARSAASRGLKVLICGAGLAAALPGRRRRAHRAAGDRRPAPLVDVGARRPRRAALDRPDAARRARSRRSASTTRRTPPCSRRASSRCSSRSARRVPA